MRRRRHVQEEHVNHERWLVSYADFITLLFAFFVVMYSISQVNESKYRVLSNTLTSAFNRPELTLDPFQVGKVAKSNPLSVIELDGASSQTEEGGEGQRNGQQPEAFIDISQRIEQALGDLIKQKLVKVSGNESWLEIELSSSLLFESGDARLSVRALEVLGQISAVLQRHDNSVRVEGFTDNVPIHTRQFPSNWELSAARAATVVRLFTEEGMNPARLSAVGYGENQPVADNESSEGRARNRRVVLKVSKQSPQALAQADPVLETISSKPGVAQPEQQAGVQLPALSSQRQAERMADEFTSREQPQAARRGNAETTSQDAPSGVRTVELEDGGLLFTRDNAAPDSGDSGTH